MDIGAGVYNRLNGAQLRDAEELIQKIKAGITKAKVIVDIGCGSGNVTSLLSQSIPHDRIVALDIDPDMVHFAQNQIKDNSIQFLVQDISQQWEKLNPLLQALEGQVDLIWSNRVLHWVHQKDQLITAQNIYRLLAPSGNFFTNITYMPNLNEFLPSEIRQENEKLIKIPGALEQQQDWTNVFQEAGFLNVTTEQISKEWTFPNNDEELMTAERHTVHYYRRYLPNEMSTEEKNQVLEQLDFSDLFMSTWFTPLGQPPIPFKELKNLSTYYYVQFRICGVKPG